VLYVLSTYPKYGPYAGVLIGLGMLVYYLVNSPWFLKKKPVSPPLPVPSSSSAVASAPRS